MNNKWTHITHLDLPSWNEWPEPLRVAIPYFKPWEFRSGDDDEFLISVPLLLCAVRLRDIIQRPLFVNRPQHGIKNRGYRSPRNQVGSANSQHRRGLAFDCEAPGLTTDELAEAAEGILEFQLGGIGRYRWGCHLDIRTNGPRRWDERT